MTKDYLTGSKGFIGSYLRPYLEERGDEITSTADAQWERYKIPTGTDVVYHLGALVRPQESMQQRTLYFDANVRATLDLLEAVKLNAPSAKVVLFGSATQDHLDSWYGYTKAMAELAGDAYAKFDGLSVYKLRLFGVTGIGKSGDVVNDFAEQAARDGRIRHGDLSVARDISDVRDVVPAIERLVRTSPPGVYHIGRGEAIPIRYIAEWFGVPLEPEESRVRKEDSVHVSPARSVDARPIRATLWWVYDAWQKKVGGKSP